MLKMCDDVPENTRWSLRPTTKCGLELYLRPCQRTDFVEQAGLSFPHPQVCRTDMEAVFVAESDETQRNFLLGVVQDLGYHAIGVSTAAEFFSQVAEFKSGCVLLDMRLPGIDALVLLERLKEIGVTLPIIFVSAVTDVDTIVQCMKLGAVDVLLKPIGEMPLRRAILTAVAESQQRNCVSQSRAIVMRLVSLLTPTELTVARMIAKGFPTKLIAAAMQRSENTVKIHRHRIFNKLMVNSAASVANIMHHVEGESLDT